MTYRFSLLIAIAASFIVVMFPSSVFAEEGGRGLYVSPARYEINIAAGEKQTKKITIANHSDTLMIVDLSVKKFSVTDYKYDHKFDQANLDWVKLSTDRMRLQPNEEKVLTYVVDIPKNYAAGGYYFSILLSTTMEKDGVKGTVQAASLLYVTVDGDKARKSGEIKNEQMSSWLTDIKIPYKFDFTNTGNVHLKGYFFARLDGVFGEHAEVGSYRVSLPETTRMIEGVMSAPMLPGMYQLTYGYKDDGIDIVKSKYIVFIPPWSMAALLLVGLTVKWLWQRHGRKRKA